MPLSKLNKIPSQCMIAFLTCFLGGYFVHLYGFTNIIPNSDGLQRVYDLQEMTVSGRWFLHYATSFSGFMQMPAFIALSSLLFLSFSVVLLTDLLEIKFKALAGALALSFVSFPSLGFTYLYLFTATAYSIGIFLAIFSVWFMEKKTNFWYVSVLALACSMGIYQAYAAFAVGLSVLVVIKKTVCPQEKLKEVFSFGVKSLCFLAAGAGVYYLILHIILFLTGQELLPYLGMEQGVYPFHTLPYLVFATYKQVISFFFISGTGTSTLPLAIFNLSIIILGIVGFVMILKPFAEEKDQRWRIFSVLFLCCILPLALGFSQIISPWSAPTPLMQYPYVLAYTLVIFFVDNGFLKSPIPWRRKYVHSVLVNFFLISMCGAWLCNLLYTASAQAHRSTESYVTRVMTQVEMTEGYYWGMPIVVIGAFPQQQFYPQIEAYKLIDHYSVPSSSVLPLNKHIYYYWNHWLNIPVTEPSEATMIRMSNHQEFLKMPCYPDWGSVAVIEGNMVVKIAEEYLPKSDYELAYENRK